MILLNCSKLFIFQKYFTSIFPMSYLHIAQKNSIAKEVSNILSDGTKRLGPTKSTFNPVYEFTIDNQLQRFSSVRGHLFQYQLPQQCKSWARYDNRQILTRNVGIIKKCGPDMQNIIKNLEDLSRKSKHLILWLDCDRQGQSIAYQVIQICLRANKNLKIKRARFSAVTRPDILQAYNNLVQPNQRQANAVKYRMEIDFRLGCTFTRYQTLAFRQRYFSKEAKVISYGPCQLPTLGFVVERYLQIKYFQPEDYYFLKGKWSIDNKTSIDFKWNKKNTRNKTAIALIYVNMYQKTNGQMMGKVIKRSSTIKKRYRPYPLTTVQLQKIGTDKLRLSSAKIMQVAQKLYVNGFISYPRTQTNSFPKTMNLKSLVERLRPNNQYSNYVDKLLNQNKYQNPKTGNSDDQAHSPIHPVKNANKDNLTHEQWKVYDLVSRHFLACCSKDAIGQQFQILAQIGGQQFKSTYLTIKELNFLEIYPFIKWLQSSLPAQIPNQFPASVTVQQQKTKPPQYLSESNLIQMMQKNNIGTDSTIHEHIKTIQDRRYAVKSNNTLKPTSLGAAIIIAYRNLGMIIAECDVRRMMEQNMERIASGQIDHNSAAINTLEFMIPIYQQLMNKKQIWTEQIGKAMMEHQNLQNVVQQNTGQNSNYLSNNNFNNNNTTNSNSNSFTNNNQISGQVTCYRCKQPGHYANQCPNQPGDRSNSAQPTTQSSYPRSLQQLDYKYSNYSRNNSSNNNIVNSKKPNTPATTNYTNNNNSNNYMSDVTCYRCNQKGHFAPNCPNINQKGKAKDSDGRVNNRNKSQNKGGFKSKWNNNKNSYQYGNSSSFSNSYGENNNSKEFQQKQKKPKICKQCGIQGRHPKNSTCGTLKKNRTIMDFL